ncbi:MAG: response regulator receiver protein [Ferruginibacter sp.]|nr:response regulator receiver protein [Ferruginibacter sp.]
MALAPQSVPLLTPFPLSAGTVPAQEATHPGNYFSTHKQTSLPSLHIMLVDDDAEDREIFEEAIREVNPEIRLSTISSCEDVIDELMKPAKKPDLVILDLNMPKKNGFECLEELREIDELAAVPVMVYSTTANAEQVTRAYEKKANMYLQKPSSFEGIKALITMILALDPEHYIPQAPQNNFLVQIQQT